VKIEGRQCRRRPAGAEQRRECEALITGIMAGNSGLMTGRIPGRGIVRIGVGHGPELGQEKRQARQYGEP